MSPAKQEYQLNVGAITAGQAVGYHLDSFKNAFGPGAYIEYAVIDNRSDATLTLISHPTRPDVLGGERKHVPLGSGYRDVFVEASATVSSGDVRVTIGVVG